MIPCVLIFQDYIFNLDNVAISRHKSNSCPLELTHNGTINIKQVNLMTYLTWSGHETTEYNNIHFPRFHEVKRTGHKL